MYGFGPRLQDVELVIVAVLGSLDVHGAAIVVLDGKSLPRQLLHFLVGKPEHLPVLLGNVHEFRGSPH